MVQEPAEIDPNIISQCSTFFVMRLANDRDQSLIRAAVSDAAASLLTFIPSLGTREVFTFGYGVALPTRMRFVALPDELRPHSEASGSTRSDAVAVTPDLINTVIERWRSASMSHRVAEEMTEYGASLEAPLQPAPPPPIPQVPVAPPVSPRGEALRASLLKKPLDATLGGSPQPQSHPSRYR